MLRVRVKGGTNAGVRRVKPQPEPWAHTCTGDPAVPVTLPGYWACCPVCRKRRP